MACLRRRAECNDNVLLFDFVTSSCCGGGQDTAGTIGIRRNNQYKIMRSRPMKAGLVKSLAD